MGNAFLLGNSGGGLSDNKIKQYLNSTVGTEDEKALDELIGYQIANITNSNVVEFEESGYYYVKVPDWATKAKITACAGGGGGGSPETTSYGGWGGGGGAAIFENIYDLSSDITSDRVIEIEVGSGGGWNNNAAGSNGNPTNITWFSSQKTIVYLNGGIGGVRGINSIGTNYNSFLKTSGLAGGDGGGAGGQGWVNSTYPSSAGKNGIVGKGGNRQPVEYGAGGGGGSLGVGGSTLGNSGNNGDYSHNGIRGGGGAGGDLKTYNACGGYGGDGYVKIVWLP